MSTLRFIAVALAFVASSLVAACNANHPTPPEPEAEPSETATGMPLAAELEPSLPDAEVRSAISRALKLDDAVPARFVDVTVRKGVATLTGSVPHLLAHEHAITVAENVRGVRAVVDRLSVEPTIRTDRALAADVWKALDLDAATEPLEVTVDVKHGVVTLSGHVDSWAEAELAHAVASGVRGVQRVDDRITVKPLARRPDPEILRDVRGRLRHDALIDDAGIRASVERGVVTLDGAVASAGERARAADVSWVDGVEAVHADGLEVRYWDRERFRQPPVTTSARSDRAIEDAIQDALRADPRVGEFEIDVSVERGMATLDGAVDNLLARTTAERDARDTVGVLGVFNFLTVTPSAVVPDHALQERATAVLDQDPYFGPGTVQALVDKGTVHLVGRVDDRFQRDHAEEVVGRLNGVVALKSELVVRTPLPQPDGELQRKIEERLKWDALLSGTLPRVSVVDGVATVSGTVPNQRDERIVLRHLYAAGATEVVNDLVVQPREPAQDLDAPAITPAASREPDTGRHRGAAG